MAVIEILLREAQMGLGGGFDIRNEFNYSLKQWIEISGNRKCSSMGLRAGVTIINATALDVFDGVARGRRSADVLP